MIENKSSLVLFEDDPVDLSWIRRVPSTQADSAIRLVPDAANQLKGRVRGGGRHLTSGLVATADSG